MVEYLAEIIAAVALAVAIWTRIDNRRQAERGGRVLELAAQLEMYNIIGNGYGGQTKLDPWRNRQDIELKDWITECARFTGLVDDAIKGDYTVFIKASTGSAKGQETQDAAASARNRVVMFAQARVGELGADIRKLRDEFSK